MFKTIKLKLQRWWYEMTKYEFHHVSIWNEGGEIFVRIDMDDVKLPENSSMEFAAKIPSDLIETMEQFREDAEKGEVDVVGEE